METFSVRIGIGHRDREEWLTLDALVDTGASITSAPASQLRELGVERRCTQPFTLADGATRELEVGEARVRAGGREITTLVLFNREGSKPVLGALALQGMFLSVDPVEQRLVPVEGWLAGGPAKGGSPRGFPANAEWAIDEMPALPLNVGLAMVRTAARELVGLHGVDAGLVRQHRLAAQEADNKWQAQQSQRKNEAAQRFRIRAKGCAALASALGGGYVVGTVATLVIEHLLLA